MLTAEQLSRLYPHQRTSNPIDNRLFDAVKEAVEWYKQSLYKQLINRETDNDIRLRPSMLGKAAIDILARKFFPELYQDDVSHDRFWQLLHDGDTFECDYRVHLALLGVDVIESQVACNWYGVKGHADMIVGVDNKRVLLELKTSNEGYFGSIMKMQKPDERQFRYPNDADKEYLLCQFSDFRGHITQASIYADALNCDEAVIALKDKNTSEVVLYNLTRKEREDSLIRAKRAIEAWDSSDSWIDVFCYAGIPEPKKELANKNHTGRYLVNPKLYGSPIIPLIYEWTLDKDKVIIDGYRVPEEIIDSLPDKLRETYEDIGVYTYGIEQVPELLGDWQRYQAYKRKA